MNSLLAKSAQNGKHITLVEHTQHVLDAAAALFGTATYPTRLGECWLRFFQIDPTDWPLFYQTLIASCALHDWGKANDGMQMVLTGSKGGQLFRHEHISVLLLGHDGIGRWLRQRRDIDWDVALAAIGSHHLKFAETSFAEEVPGEVVRVLFDHPEFQKELLSLIAQQLDLAGSPTFPRQKYWGFADDAATFDPSELREALKDGPIRGLTRLCYDPQQPRARLLRAVRAALIAADGAGSGLPRTGLHITDWIQEQFTTSALCDHTTIWSVIQKRVDDLARRGKWAKWNSFQDACETLPERALLLAPCGSGKTLAAWRWIAAQVQRQPVKRVFFLYPTRATATEGFKDYVSWAPETATLVHGTAEYDLEDMFPAEDPRYGNKFSTDPRLFALRLWSKQIFSATVDQFLAFMSYAYGPVCLLPLLADSVMVVDEVHSFDRAMFSALLGFLKTFQVPVLCMTATLPEPRQRQLSEAGLLLANPKPEDLQELAAAPRYRVSCIEETAVKEQIRSALHQRKRVLWVVNQVSRAQQYTRELASDFQPLDETQTVLHGPSNKRLFCYHSRFKLDDRVKRHREVIQTLRPGEPAALAITTQVCEMSLDIDADLLVTEECPITSLIQRMGRCRRGRDELASKGPGEVLVYRPAEERVYKKDDLAGLQDFLAFIMSKGAVNQSDLETGLEKYGPVTAETPKLNSFLASGAYAVGGDDPFRDMDAFHIQAVLRSELDKYLTAGREEKPGFILPVPKKTNPQPDSRLPRYLAVADHTHYHPATGFWDTAIR